MTKQEGKLGKENCLGYEGKDCGGGTLVMSNVWVTLVTEKERETRINAA